MPGPPGSKGGEAGNNLNLDLRAETKQNYLDLHKTMSSIVKIKCHFISGMCNIKSKFSDPKKRQSMIFPSFFERLIILFRVAKL